MRTSARFLFALSAAFLAAIPVPGARPSDEENFNKSMENTLAVIEKHHLIALVDIDLDFEGKAKGENRRRFRYDRYPEVERIQMKDGKTYAREKGKGWIKSDDWGKSGDQVPAEKVEALDAMVSFARAPLRPPVSKDKSQGANVITPLKREPHDGYELVFYEMRREKPTGFAYPKFVFLKYPKDADDRLLLKGFAGIVNSGGDRVWVNINYEYMFMVNVVEEKAAPKPARPAAPAPEEGEKIYNFTELDQKKMELKGRVVRLRIQPKVLQSEDLGDGNRRLMVKDTAEPKAFYGMVDFPKEGADKLGLSDKSAKENLTLYVLVTPRNAKVVAQITALGTRFEKGEDGTTVYAW